jgi:hypothetical protein
MTNCFIWAGGGAGFHRGMRVAWRRVGRLVVRTLVSLGGLCMLFRRLVIMVIHFH